MKRLVRLELQSTSRKPCLFSVQVCCFWLELDLGSAWCLQAAAAPSVGVSVLAQELSPALDQQGSGRARLTCSSRFPFLETMKRVSQLREAGGRDTVERPWPRAEGWEP